MQLIVVYNCHYIYVVKLLNAGMGRKRRLPLVKVGQGSSHSRQRVEKEMEDTHISEGARSTASDDETQHLGNSHVFKYNV